MCGWMCGWNYLYISVFSPNTFQQVLFGPQLEEHPLRFNHREGFKDLVVPLALVS